MLVDSHTHLSLDGREKVDVEYTLARAKAAGVEKLVNVGTSLKDSREAIELAQKYAGVFATVGIHPNDNPSATVENVDWEEFESLARQSKVVAIGECGLDYSRIMEHEIWNKEQEKERQKKLFSRQIETAQKLDLPLSIHIRDAQGNLMEMLNRVQHDEIRGVFHCFSGDKNYLDFILNRLPYFYISFAGNITFRNAQALRDLAKDAPLDRMLVETDSPFLAPDPLRGQQNESANVKIVAEKLAEIKEVSFEQICEVTTKNAERLFHF